MITVFHKGDAPEILATLTELGIAVTEFDLRRCPPEAAWAAGQHLVAIGRATKLGGDDGAYELLTPTTTIDNGYGRSIIAGDHPDTVLAKLPPAEHPVDPHDPLDDGRGAEALVKVAALLAPVCPECRNGKHRVCAELALDEATDEIVPCACPPAFGHSPRNIAQGAEHTGRGHA